MHIESLWHDYINVGLLLSNWHQIFFSFSETIYLRMMFTYCSLCFDFYFTLEFACFICSCFSLL